MPMPKLPSEDSEVARKYRAMAEMVYGGSVPGDETSSMSMPEPPVSAPSYQSNEPTPRGEAAFHGKYRFFQAGDKRFRVKEDQISDFATQSMSQGFEPEELSIYKTRDNKVVWVKKSKEKKFQDQFESYGYPVGEYQQNEKTGKHEWISPTQHEVVNTEPGKLTPNFKRQNKTFKSPDEIGIYKINDMDLFLSHQEQAKRDAAARELKKQLDADMEKNKLSESMTLNTLKAIPSSVADAGRRYAAGAQNLVGGRAGTLARMAEYYEADPVRMLPGVGGAISAMKELATGVKPEAKPRTDGLESNTVSSALRGAQKYYSGVEKEIRGNIDPVMEGKITGNWLADAVLRGAVESPSSIPAMTEMVTGGAAMGAVSKAGKVVNAARNIKPPSLLMQKYVPTLKKLINSENITSAALEGFQSAEQGATEVRSDADKKAEDLSTMTVEEFDKAHGNEPEYWEATKELNAKGISDAKAIQELYLEKVNKAVPFKEQVVFNRNFLTTALGGFLAPQDVGEAAIKIARGIPLHEAVKMSKKELARIMGTPLVSESGQELFQSAMEEANIQAAMPERADPKAIAEAGLQGIGGALTFAPITSAASGYQATQERKNEAIKSVMRTAKETADNMKESDAAEAETAKIMDELGPAQNIVDLAEEADTANESATDEAAIIPPSMALMTAPERSARTKAEKPKGAPPAMPLSAQYKNSPEAMNIAIDAMETTDPENPHAAANTPIELFAEEVTKSKPKAKAKDIALAHAALVAEAKRNNALTNPEVADEYQLELNFEQKQLAEGKGNEGKQAAATQSIEAAQAQPVSTPPSAPISATTPVTATRAAAKASEPAAAAPAYDEMTQSQLYATAKRRGINWSSRQKKEDIVRMLKFMDENKTETAAGPEDAAMSENEAVNNLIAAENRNVERFNKNVTKPSEKRSVLVAKDIEVVKHPKSPIEKVIAAISKALGKDVVMVRVTKAGHNLSTRGVYTVKKATNSKGKTVVVTNASGFDLSPSVLMHEVTHALYEEDFPMYEKLLEGVKKVIGEDEWLKARKRIKSVYAGNTKIDIDEETLTNIITSSFNKEENLRKLAALEPEAVMTIGQRLKAAIEKVVSYIKTEDKARFARGKMDKQDYETYFDKLSEVADQWIAVAQEVQKATPKQKPAEAKAPAKTEAKPAVKPPVKPTETVDPEMAKLKAEAAKIKEEQNKLAAQAEKDFIAKQKEAGAIDGIAKSFNLSDDQLAILKDTPANLQSAVLAEMLNRNRQTPATASETPAAKPAKVTPAKPFVGNLEGFEYEVKQDNTGKWTYSIGYKGEIAKDKPVPVNAKTQAQAIDAAKKAIADMIGEDITAIDLPPDQPEVKESRELPNNMGSMVNISGEFDPGRGSFLADTLSKDPAIAKKNKWQLHNIFTQKYIPRILSAMKVDPADVKLTNDAVGMWGADVNPNYTVTIYNPEKYNIDDILSAIGFVTEQTAMVGIRYGAGSDTILTVVNKDGSPITNDQAAEYYRKLSAADKRGVILGASIHETDKGRSLAVGLMTNEKTDDEIEETRNYLNKLAVDVLGDVCDTAVKEGVFYVRDNDWTKQENGEGYIEGMYRNEDGTRQGDNGRAGERQLADRAGTLKELYQGYREEVVDEIKRIKNLDKPMSESKAEAFPFIDKKPVAKPQLVIMVGPAGAGKTSALNRAIKDRSSFVEINPDDFSTRTGNVGMNEKGKLKEDLHHEKASEVSKRQLKKATANKYNTIYDTLGGNYDVMVGAIERTLRNGGTVQIIGIDTDPVTSRAQTHVRFDTKERRQIPGRVIVDGYNTALPTFMKLYEKYSKGPNSARINPILYSNQNKGMAPEAVIVNRRVMDPVLFDQMKSMPIVRNPNTNKFERANRVTEKDLSAPEALREIGRRRVAEDVRKSGFGEVRNYNPETARPGIEGELRRGMDDLEWMASAMEEATKWYTDTEAALEKYIPDKNDRKMFALFLAATSANTGVATNVKSAIKNFALYKQGKSVEGMKAHTMNMERALEGQPLAGPKVSAFSRALLGDTSAITIDLHMGEIFFDSDKPTAFEIETGHKVVNELADRMKWTPRETQAALWAANFVRRNMIQNSQQMDMFKPEIDEKMAAKARDQKFGREFLEAKTKVVFPTFAEEIEKNVDALKSALSKKPETETKEARTNNPMFNGAKVGDKSSVIFDKPLTQADEDAAAQIKHSGTFWIRTGRWIQDRIDQATPTSDVAGGIHKALRAAFNNFSLRQNDLTNGNAAITKPFRKFMKGLSEADNNKMSLWLFSGDRPKAVALYEKLGGKTDDLLRAFNVIDQFRIDAVAAGVSMGFIDQYFPRLVTDYEGLAKTLGEDLRIPQSEVENAIREMQAISERKELQDFEKMVAVSGVMSQFASRNGIGFTMSRKLSNLPPKYLAFYARPEDSLAAYIQSMGKTVALKELMGGMSPDYKKAVRKYQLLWKNANAMWKDGVRMYQDATTPEGRAEAEQILVRAYNKGRDLQVAQENLQKFADEMVRSGASLSMAIGKKIPDISNNDLRRIGRQLAALANEGRSTKNAAERALDNVLAFSADASYLMQLTHFKNAIINLADLTKPVMATGFFRGIAGLSMAFLEQLPVVGKALKQKGYVTMDDLNMKADPEGLMKQASHYARIITFNSFVESIATNALLRAKAYEIQSLIAKGKAGDQAAQRAADNKISKLFGEVTTDILDALGSPDLNEMKRRYAYGVASAWMPIGGTNSSIIGRSVTGKNVKHLRSYMIQYWQTLMNEGIKEVVAGSKTKDVGRTMEGLRVTASIPALAYASAVAVRLLVRSLMRGQENDDEDLLKQTALDELMQLFGVSRYTLKAARDGSPIETITGILFPSLGWTPIVAKDVKDFMDPDKDLSVRNARTTRLIPVVGDLYYYFKGRGDMQKHMYPNELVYLQSLANEWGLKDTRNSELFGDIGKYQQAILDTSDESIQKDLGSQLKAEASRIKAFYKENPENIEKAKARTEEMKLENKERKQTAIEKLRSAAYSD